MQVDGDFEASGETGWAEWRAPWGTVPLYEYSSGVDPFEGRASFYMRAASGSFGVYQELCVSPGEAILASWAWKGKTAGNGWWELLLVDGPYSYAAVDDPAGHPETVVVGKWETGLGGVFPRPGTEWTSAEGEFLPTGDLITVVLKCGSTEGARVEAWFDAVVLDQEVGPPEIAGMSPREGPARGGTPFRITGRVFPEGSSVTIGGLAAEPVQREGSCELRGVTPPGAPGAAEVLIRTPGGTAVLDGGFRYTASESSSFLRGDCNEDGLTDVSDAVCILAYQFLGESDRSCLAALDVNGDAAIDLTDPVYFLAYSFLSGDEPVAPFPECGPVLRSQDLEVGCASTTKNCQ